MGRYSLYAALELVGGKKGTFCLVEVCKMCTTGNKRYLRLSLLRFCNMIIIIFYLNKYSFRFVLKVIDDLNGTCLYFPNIKSVYC